MNQTKTNTFLCAGCGKIILIESSTAQESLCEACEERVMAGGCSWVGKNKEKVNR